jgi:F-type H+-transporting ATPase subunit delta
MLERVQGYADAVLEDVGRGEAGTVAGELVAFGELLAASGDLRGALDSGATPGPARRSIIRELLASRVSAPAIELLSFAVQSGPGADYVADVAGITAAAVAKRDGLVPRGEGPLGRTAAAERLEGYATAVLAPVHERHLADIEDELFRFMRIVEGNDELRYALTTAELSASARQSVAAELLARRARPECARLAAYTARVGRPRDYVLLLNGLVERVAQEANRRVADVRSASEMSEAQRLRLAAALTRFTGYPVEVRVTTQPELLGGFVASVGDTVVDASLRHRLEQARGLLLSPPTRSGEADEETSTGQVEH